MPEAYAASGIRKSESQEAEEPLSLVESLLTNGRALLLLNQGNAICLLLK